MKLKKETFKTDFADLHLCYTNKKRKELNHMMMDKIVRQKKRTPLKLDALEYDGNSQDVKLVSGMPVICRKTCKDLDIMNNETFTIKEVQHRTNMLILENEFNQIEMPFDMFQHLFYVAYAITIHKSQAATIRTPYTIHEWDKLHRRLRDVALSRATCVDNLNVI
jgi:hypothetical protein